ncbi:MULTISPECIES: response regulator [Cellvibrio]|jgi:DNA-binding response OmpR family regulator|uniref:DNA-binding response OmpR family regulator n=1 Tax=Cellvibrio fibrivorans TaxID=126350 RepID=A0ABU1UZ65_9GAMM|nr:response regulator [Cellvibrio fibrivorans]MDR7090483.1 DNA-binding response OmpR family regulator [Cellvibrio fibrivorans]
MQILLVEDDELLAEGIVSALSRAGFAVNWLSTGKAACTQVVAEPPDIMLLDLGLPDIDGIEVLKVVRQKKLPTQVLILTARDSTNAKVIGLDSGADDYLTKPFELDELLARLRVLERRLGNSSSSLINIGPLSLNTAHHEVLLDGAALVLSRREYMLLKALVEHAGVIQTREGLEAKLYSWGDEVASNAIEVHIHNLRKKLPPNFIRTLRGIGYMVPRQ